jgi:RNA polymerase sigma-70 factor, ECF subfamily
MAEDEKTLVARASRHDPEAFARLYDRYVDKIYKYINYKAGRTNAEDLTAQVFLKSWAAVGDYRMTQRPFSAWLFRIAHNLVVDYFRTQRETISLDQYPVGDESRDDVEELAEHHLDSETLRLAMKRLTDEQQQVIILKFIVGYNTDEVAHLLNKHPAAVRALQHRALISLERIMGRASPAARPFSMHHRRLHRHLA